MSKESVISDYQWEAWASRLGSKPVDLIISADFGESYETDNAEVYELEDGKFAMIVESGCSCYETSDADVEVFPSVGPAMESFMRWRAEKRKYRHEHG